jgi:hypothetical protein
MGRKSFSFPVTTLVGTDVSNFLAICRKHSIGISFYPKLIFSFLVAAIFELFNLWERVVLRNKMKNYRMKEPPVFIIGFWRSGTTLLHNLLCSDPRAGYTTTFQAVFPHITITQAWWIKPLANWIVPENRPFDNVSWDMDSPQEEEFGLANLQSNSLYNSYIFPGDYDRFLKEEFFTEDFPPQQLKKWKEKYTSLVHKAMLSTGGNRYISKNPCHLGRLNLMHSMFPDAKYIFIYRNPYQVVESLYWFYQSILPGVKLQKLKPGFSRKDIVDLYCVAIRNYFKTRSVIPPEDLLELKMEDFMKDKMGYLEMIYRKFGMDSFEKAKPCFEKYLSDNSNYFREKYDIPQETFDLVNEYVPDILEEFGYQKRTSGS